METQQQTENTAQDTLPTASHIPVRNPLADLVSHFEDDPFWDGMMESIRRHRLELDAAEADRALHKDIKLDTSRQCALFHKPHPTAW